MADSANITPCALFHPGQFVQCLNDAPTFVGGAMDGLTEGRVYTVRAVLGDSIRLHEITGRKGDCPYFAWRFRPVDDGRLAVFRAMLVRKTEAA